MGKLTDFYDFDDFNSRIPAVHQNDIFLGIFMDCLSPGSIANFIDGDFKD